MSQENNLSPKEIKYGMSPTPWRKSEHGLVIIKGNSWKIKFERPTAGGGDFEEHSIRNLNCDIAAINNAVNNTYGKNLNPEVYEDIVNALDKCCYGDGEKMVTLQELLNKARIWHNNL